MSHKYDGGGIIAKGFRTSIATETYCSWRAHLTHLHSRHHDHSTIDREYIRSRRTGKMCRNYMDGKLKIDNRYVQFSFNFSAQAAYLVCSE